MSHPKHFVSVAVLLIILLQESAALRVVVDIFPCY